MFSQRPLTKKLSQKMRKFSQHCTLHGFYYLYNSEHTIIRAAWLVIVALSSVLCTYLSHLIWIKYFTDPTFTMVQSTEYPIVNIPFPTITICENEPMYGPNTKNVTMILQNEGYNESQIDLFFNSFKSVRYPDFVLTPELRRMHKLFEDSGYTVIDLLDLFHKPCDVLLVKCLWRSKQHHCSEMFRQLRTLAGVCCQFEIEHFRKFADHKTILHTGLTISEALDFSVNSKKVSAKGITSDGYLQLLVINSLTYATFVHNSITLTPGGLFDVILSVETTESSDEVKALDLESRQCLIDTDPIPQPHFYEGCLTRLMLIEVIDRCHCIPFKLNESYVGRYGLPPCAMEHLYCFYRNLGIEQEELSKLIPMNFCLKTCDYIKFYTKTSVFKREIYEKTDDERTNLTRVVIHYVSSTFKKYRREVLYTWDQMLAHLGGIFGLFLGGSIVSIIEITFFIMDLISTSLTSCKKYKRVKNHLIRDKYIFCQKIHSPKATGQKKRGNGTVYRFVH